MKKIIVIILLSFTSIFADEEVNLDSLYKEGIEIYRNAKASWLGNELLIKLLKQAGTEESLGGYFAYPENDGNHFIFYSKDAKVIAEAYFDSTFIIFCLNVVEISNNKFHRSLRGFKG